VRCAVLIGVGALVFGVSASGCAREPDQDICPAVGVGDLVVSEVRGEQTDDNSNLDQGQWVELYNASSATIDLRGLQLLFRKVDGSDEGRVIIRHSVEVAAGDRAVLSSFDDNALPAHVDYGWYPDFLNSSGNAASLFDNGVIDVLACDVQIDRVRIEDLPSAGTWSFGIEPPDAAVNDDVDLWCTDATDDTDPGTIGLPGTPGASNHPCP
jgi:hypothetical protein